MRNVFAVIGLLFLASCNSAGPKQTLSAQTDIPLIKTKELTMDDFMAGQISEAIRLPLLISIPSEYVHASGLENVPATYSYWMRPEDVEGVNATGDLPKKNGYLYGKISLDAGYDSNSDSFIGLENYKELAERSGLKVKSLERHNVAGHPVIISEIIEKASKVRVYAIWLATKYDSNVIYLAYMQPQHQEAVGAAAWAKFKESLLSNK